MKSLERHTCINSDCFRESVSFVDADGWQIAYQKVFLFKSTGWRWLTFYGDRYGPDYPQGHESLKAMRAYIRTQPKYRPEEKME